MKNRSIGRVIAILNRYSHMYFSNALRHLNIGSSEHIFLIHLLKQDGITQEDLSARVLIDKAATARAVKTLEEKGYVRREADAVDKRAKKVYCTDKARACHEEVQGIFTQWTEILSAGIPQEHIEMTVSVLERMMGNARSSVKMKDEEH